MRSLIVPASSRRPVVATHTTQCINCHATLRWHTSRLETHNIACRQQRCRSQAANLPNNLSKTTTCRRSIMRASIRVTPPAHRTMRPARSRFTFALTLLSSLHAVHARYVLLGDGGHGHYLQSSPHTHLYMSASSLHVRLLVCLRANCSICSINSLYLIMLAVSDGLLCSAYIVLFASETIALYMRIRWLYIFTYTCIVS